MMRLHYHPLSPYSRKVATAIAMRKDDIALAVVSIGSGQLSSPAFRDLSPFGKMPVLETPEGPIFESTSILEYLEEGGPRVLLPRGSERRARHLDRIGDLYLIAPVAALWWEPESPPGREAESVARTCWAVLQKELASRVYLCGDTFCLADLAAAIGTDYFLRLGVVPPPEIRAWRDRCFAIPAMEASLEAAMPFVRQTLGARARDLPA